MNNDEQDFSDEEISAVLRFQKKEQLQHHWKKLMKEKGKAEKPTEAKVVPIASSQKSKKWLWTTAASVAIVIGLFVIWLLSTPSIATVQQVAITNIEALSILPTQGTKLSNNQAIFVELTQFKKKELNTTLTIADYTNVINLVSSEEEIFIKENGLYITRAYAHLKTAQYSAAIEDLKKYINDGQWTTDEAEYYLALSYLGNGEVKAATTILEQLKKEQPKKVLPILEQLKEVQKE